jgi:hypothetical protein
MTKMIADKRPPLEPIGQFRLELGVGRVRSAPGPMPRTGGHFFLFFSHHSRGCPWGIVSGRGWAHPRLCTTPDIATSFPRRPADLSPGVRGRPVRGIGFGSGRPAAIEVRIRKTRGQGGDLKSREDHLGRGAPCLS